MIRTILAFTFAALAATTSAAQTPPSPSPVSVIQGYASLAASNSSARVALPVGNPPGPAITIMNSGAVDAFVRLGGSSVTAATTDVKIKAGSAFSMWIGSNTNLAAITASGSTTIDVWQANGPINLQPTGASSSAGASVTQGTVPWVVSQQTPTSPNFQIAPTWTVQNAAYAAGNSLGGLITVTGAARSNGGTGRLINVRIKSTSGATPTLWVYAWSKTPTSTCTDKSAFSSNAADSPYALPGFPQQVTLGGSPGSFDASTYAQIQGVNAGFKNQDSSPGTAFYMCMVVTGSLTPPTTSDYSEIVDGLQD